MESRDVDLTVMSWISPSCIPKNEDLACWLHLRGIDIPEVGNREVLLLIGLKEKPSLFLPLEFKAGGIDEPIAIRYSLGWTVIGPTGERKEVEHCSVNFVQVTSTQDMYLDRCHLNENPPTEAIGQTEVKFETAMWSESVGNRVHREPIEKLGRQAVVNLPLLKEELVDCDIDNNTLHQRLERLWKTDFGDSVIGTTVSLSVEDKLALNKMEESLQRVGEHFQVALPWRQRCPELPNNRPVAEQRLQLLKKRLLKDEELLLKYRTTMHEYLMKGHAQKVPTEELNFKERPVWYLPHHPVTHLLNPGKVSKSCF